MNNIASFTAAAAARDGDYNAKTAEQALLAAIMRDNDGWSLASQHCGPDDFLDAFHGRMFAAMGDIIAAGKPVNALSVYFAMAADPALDDEERRHYCVELATLPVGRHPSMIVDYAVAIRKYAHERKLRAMAEDLLQNPAAHTVADMAAALNSIMTSSAGSRAPRALADLSIAAIEQAEIAYKAGGDMIGVPTGLIELDRILGGLAKSDLCIIGGRPAMGKTVLAVNIAVNAARHGLATAMFSLEMSGEQLAMRFLAGETGVTTDTMRRGKVGEVGFEMLAKSASESRGLPLFIEDRPALTVSEIRAEALNIKRRHGLDLIVIDYLGLVRPDKQRESRVVDITEVSAGLKSIAKLLDVPVVCLAQLNRGLEQREDKKPLLSDLRDSGAIEQDADQVVFVYREEYYLRQSEPSDTAKKTAWETKLGAVAGLADLIVAKNRHGRTGEAKVRFNADRQRFENLQQGW